MNDLRLIAGTVVLLAALAALSPLGAAAQVERGGALPGPLPLFPPDNWWNVDVSQAPIDPQSDAYIAWIGDDALHPDFGGDVDPGDPGNPETYGMIYVVVPGSQPLEPVAFVEFGDESDDGAPGRPPGYPIPAAARTQPRWIEGGQPGNSDAGGDRHMLIVDRDRRLLYELYHLFWDADLARWEAGSGAVFPLDENRRRTEGWTSADAAGLAILPGLVRHDEAFGAEPIRHAFRVTLGSTDGHVYPASHTAGGTAGALPLGARLRLAAGKDIAQHPLYLRRIFQAMKTYGLIVADNGTDMYVTGTYDTRWDNDVLNPAFAGLRASDFEVVELGWRPQVQGTCDPGPTTLCLGEGRFRLEVEWETPEGQGAGRGVGLTADSGYFWFFDPANVEVLVKVLDGCPANGRHWVFAAGLTNTRVVLRVTDTTTGSARTYVNPLNRAFRPVQDTAAFAACP